MASLQPHALTELPDNDEIDAEEENENGGGEARAAQELAKQALSL